MWLRAGIRRAMGVPVPLVVDGTQSVAGQAIPHAPPMILLRTDDVDLQARASA